MNVRCALCGKAVPASRASPAWVNGVRVGYVCKPCEAKMTKKGGDPCVQER